MISFYWCEATYFTEFFSDLFFTDLPLHFFVGISIVRWKEIALIQQQFLKYVKNNGMDVYRVGRSFKMASNSEELLAGDDTKGSLAAIDSEPNKLA